MPNSQRLFRAREAFNFRRPVQPDQSADPRAKEKIAYLLQAYDLAQRHYDSDLQLFSARMNLFLIVQSALVTVIGSSILGSNSNPGSYSGAISGFGLLLGVAWLFVAVSSYAWVKTWRAHMVEIGSMLEKETSVPFSSALFERKPRKSSYPKDSLWGLVESFSWAVRPTLVTCFLPVLFIAGWIYLGVHAHWSGL